MLSTYLSIAGYALQIIGFGLICYSCFNLSKRVSELENSNIDARLKGVEIELINNATKQGTMI